MDFGRQRHLLAQAQALSSEIRASPLAPDVVKASYPKLVELVRLVKRFIESTAALPADANRAMWEQRGQWLQEEVAALAQERVYSADQQQYWINLVQLLFAGADACDKVLRQKAETEMSLQATTAHVGELEQRLRRMEEEQQAAQAKLSPEAAEEVLQLRSKATVLQQELDKHHGQTQALSHQLQLLIAERDALRGRVDELQGQNADLQELSEGQQQVITTLMLKAEGTSTQSSSLAQDNAQLQAHCKTLSLNLETNAQVIEKLVELNSELMDTLNRATATRQREQQQQQQEGHQGQQSGGGPPGSGQKAAVCLQAAFDQAALEAGAGGVGPESCVVPPALQGRDAGLVPPPPRLPIPPPPHVPAMASASLQSNGVGPSAAAAGRPKPALPPPLVQGPSQQQGPSLAAAFEAFLTDPDSSKGASTGRPGRTSVEALAAPPSLSSAAPLGVANSSNSGSGGLHAAVPGGAQGQTRGGGVMGLLRYVAGSDKAAASAAAQPSKQGGPVAPPST